MATVIPATSNVEAVYEDMFKEITRKLYGEETGNGLHTLGTPVAQVATSGPTAPEGERSFTNLQMDRSSQPTIEYDHHNAAGSSGQVQGTAVGTTPPTAVAQSATNVIIQQQQQQQQGSTAVVTTTTGVGVGNSNNFKSEDHLSTAFGLAALMQQNGFVSTPGTIPNSQIMNKVITTATNNHSGGSGSAAGAGLVVTGGQHQTTTNVTGGGDSQQQQQQQQHQHQQQQQQQPQVWSNEGAQDQQHQQQLQPTTQIVQWTTTPSGKLQSYTTSTQPQTQPQHQQQQQQSQSAQPTSVQPQTQVTVTPKTKNHKSRSEDHSPPIDGTNNNLNNSELMYGTPSTSGSNSLLMNPQQTSTPTLNTTNTPGNNPSATSTSGSAQQQRKKSHPMQQHNNGIQKRYVCNHCPYSTDRRDLYTRHENIHKDEKPFQCYVCLKQFNRADHVKKHFLRMHRDVPYDINKTRRHPPGTSHYRSDKGNVTILTTAENVNLEQAFLESQRQPTSSSLSIAETIEAVATATDAPVPQLKQERNDDGTLVTIQNGSNPPSNIKPKREKRFTCLYCPWSGADKWGLKRHLNTHTKPFVCLLCDYKAARSERLSTHILKVHNKRACSKCSFLGDTVEEYQIHLKEAHPHFVPSQRQSLSNNLNVLRTISNTLGNNHNNNSNNHHHHSSSNQQNLFQNDNFGLNNGSNTSNSNHGNPDIITHTATMGGWRLSASGALIPPQDLLTSGLPNAAVQKRGSERLFQYLEADGSDTEDYSRLIKMDAISRNTSSVAQDFHKAGGVHELTLPTDQQLLLNNKLPSKTTTTETAAAEAHWTTNEAAALLQSLSNAGKLKFIHHDQEQQQQLQQQTYQQRYSHLHINEQQRRSQHSHSRRRQHSTGEEDDHTPSSATSSISSDGLSPMKCAGPSNIDCNDSDGLQCNVMPTFLDKNFDLQEIALAATVKAAAITVANDSFLQNTAELKRKHIPIHRDVNARDPSLYQHENQENREQFIRSSPAYKSNHNINNHSNYYYNNHYKMRSSLLTAATDTGIHQTSIKNSLQQQQQHLSTLPLNGTSALLDLHNKENAYNASLLSQIDLQDLNKIGAQFQNYVKDIINKYYASETPNMLNSIPAVATAQQGLSKRLTQSMAAAVSEHTSPIIISPRRKRILSETEEYIEYLKNKEDITLTITPKVQSKTAPLAPSVTTFAPVLSVGPLPPLKRERDLASDSYKRNNTLKKFTTANLPTHQQEHHPICNINNSNYNKSNSNHFSNHNNINKTSKKKSITQLASLLPLLADAASQHPFLAAPLDFSKKNSNYNDVTITMTNQHKPSAPNNSIETIYQQTSQHSDAVTICPEEQQSTKKTQNMDKRSSRKQAQPKKIRAAPEVIIGILRDKYLNLMVVRKLSCFKCMHKKRSSMLLFNYHTKASLALHNLWKHRWQQHYQCRQCNCIFPRLHSLQLHKKLHHTKISTNSHYNCNNKK